jgi:hypothetical protein
MFNSIILSGSLFGSVYLFSKSLETINMSQLENRKIPKHLILINNLTFVLSGSIFMYFTYTYAKTSSLTLLF